MMIFLSASSPFWGWLWAHDRKEREAPQWSGPGYDLNLKKIQSPGWTFSYATHRFWPCPWWGLAKQLFQEDLAFPEVLIFSQSALSLFGHGVELEFPLEEIPRHLQPRLQLGILNDGYVARQIMWITVRAQKYTLCKASMLSTENTRFLTDVKSSTLIFLFHKCQDHISWDN